MAQHQVTYALPDRELGSADIRFQMQRSDTILGTLLVSEGAVVWPKWQYGRGRGDRKLRWTEFDEVMQENGKPEFRRRVRS